MNNALSGGAGLIFTKFFPSVRATGEAIIHETTDKQLLASIFINDKVIDISLNYYVNEISTRLACLNFAQLKDAELQARMLYFYLLCFKSLL